MKENIIVRHYYVLQDNITVLPMVGGKRILLSRGYHGLGKQKGIVLEIIEHNGCLILHRDS